MEIYQMVKSDSCYREIEKKDLFLVLCMFSVVF